VADRSPAQLYARVIGLSLVAAGVLGFFYSGDFRAPGKVDDAFGILSVNGWHNVVHLVTGALGLALAGRRDPARAYAGGLGVVYLVVAVWGIALGAHGSILGFLPVNSEDDVLHVLLAVLGLAAAALSHEPRRLKPRLAA